MKNFLKTIGYGLMSIFTAFISVVTIAAACVGFFVTLPTKTGIAAVALFIFSLAQLIAGGGLVYVLGYDLSNGE